MAGRVSKHACLMGVSEHAHVLGNSLVVGTVVGTLVVKNKQLFLFWTEDIVQTLFLFALPLKESKNSEVVFCFRPKLE